ncbi:MAG: TonB-dependent receptor [Bacteroidetes bacterium]|nr:TonB-dependent receptor [Bacteroidota bacterium]
MRIFFFCVVFFCSAFAEDLPDSTRLFKLNEIVVTGNRLLTESRKLSSSVQVLDSLELHSVNGSSLADAVKFQHGIFLSSYGSTGALQTASLRGLASDYTLILIDGERFNTFQIGTVDLGIFPLSNVERIEIVNGGNSALYGADAVGGVINVITKHAVTENSLSAKYSLGSFNFQSYGIEAAQIVHKIFLRANLSIERAANNFPFTFSDGLQTQQLKREGADYSSKIFSGEISSSVTENIFSRLSLRLSEADRGQPNAVMNFIQNNRARILDKNAFLTFKTDWSHSQENIFSLQSSYQYKFQNYSDPALRIGGKNVDAVYYNQMISLTPSVQTSFDGGNKLFAGIELVRGIISSNELYPRRRDQFSAYVSSQFEIQNIFNAVFYPAVRYDTYSDVNGDFCPKIGINIGVTSFENIRIRASYGKNYRIPTFNDLYWIEGGNPNLHAERSLSGDVGIIGSVDWIGKFEAEAAYFSIQTKDKIVWKPMGGTLWSPVNISAVSSTGIEANVRSSFFKDGIIIQWNYTLTNSIKTSADVPNDATQGKRIPYLPKETAHLLFTGSFQNVSCNIRYSFSSFLFTQADNNPQKILSAYSTIDGNISFQFSALGVRSTAKLEINNLTNEEYTFILNYPVPLRNYRFSIQTTI